MSINQPMLRLGLTTFNVQTASTDARISAVRNAIAQGISLLDFEPLATLLTNCHLSINRVKLDSPVTRQTHAAFVASAEAALQRSPVATLCVRRLLVTPQSDLLLVYTLHNEWGGRLTTVDNQSRISALDDRDMIHVFGSIEGHSGARLAEGVLTFFRNCAGREVSRGAAIMASAQAKLSAIPMPVK